MMRGVLLLDHERNLSPATLNTESQTTDPTLDLQAMNLNTRNLNRILVKELSKAPIMVLK